MFSATKRASERKPHKPIALMATNAIGILLYLFVASKTWLPSDERGQGIPVAGGDAIYWVMIALPLLFLFFLMNLGWLIFRIRKTEGDGKLALDFVVIAACWFVAILVDQHMQS